MNELAINHVFINEGQENLGERVCRFSGRSMEIVFDGSFLLPERRKRKEDNLFHGQERRGRLKSDVYFHNAGVVP